MKNQYTYKEIINKSLTIKYQNIIFDNDGVLVNTNYLKEKNISLVVRTYSDKATATDFVKYFVKYNGIPREKKIKKYFSEQVSEKILSDYNLLNQETLYTADLVEGVKKFLEILSEQHNNLHVLSGGDENEVKGILKHKQILKYFKQVKGGPHTKTENLQAMNLTGKCLFIGDSIVDYKLAMDHAMDFIFVFGYTSFKDWEHFVRDKKHISCIKNFTELNRLIS